MMIEPGVSEPVSHKEDHVPVPALTPAKEPPHKRVALDLNLLPSVTSFSDKCKDWFSSEPASSMSSSPSKIGYVSQEEEEDEDEEDQESSEEDEDIDVRTLHEIMRKNFRESRKLEREKLKSFTDFFQKQEEQLLEESKSMMEMVMKTITSLLGSFSPLSNPQTPGEKAFMDIAKLLYNSVPIEHQPHLINQMILLMDAYRKNLTPTVVAVAEEKSGETDDQLELD